VFCPSCGVDINDPAPECPKCGFHVRQLDAVFGAPPERRGPVTDGAGVLEPEEAARIEARIAALAAATRIDLAVATVRSSAPRLPRSTSSGSSTAGPSAGPRTPAC